MDVMRKFRLKQEYRTLFTNLATGQPLDLPEAFTEQGAPIRKALSGSSNVGARERQAALLQALVDAGFVERTGGAAEEPKTPVKGSLDPQSR